MDNNAMMLIRFWKRATSVSGQPGCKAASVGTADTRINPYSSASALISAFVLHSSYRSGGSVLFPAVVFAAAARAVAKDNNKRAREMKRSILSGISGWSIGERED